MSHTVRFIGGPQGGEIRAYPERPPMTIQVLAARDLAVNNAANLAARENSAANAWWPIDRAYDIEEYQVRLQTPEGYCEAFWVNPNKSLRKQMDEDALEILHLKGVITELHTIVNKIQKDDRAAKALATLKEYLSK